MKAHYIEIVSNTVDEQCQILEKIHGMSFGAAVPDLGNARVSQNESGTLVGVRAPLAEHDVPIVRTYIAVDDIEKAIKGAEAAGAVVAYPPTKQGDTGTWAIYIADGTQHGLWQK